MLPFKPLCSPKEEDVVLNTIYCLYKSSLITINYRKTNKNLCCDTILLVKSVFLHFLCHLQNPSVTLKHPKMNAKQCLFLRLTTLICKFFEISLGTSIIGFPTGRDSATFWYKGTEVSSLSQDKGTTGRAQNLAAGRARTAYQNLGWDKTRHGTINSFLSKSGTGRDNHHFFPMISCFWFFFLFLNVLFLV